MTTNITAQSEGGRSRSGSGSWVAEGRKSASRLRGANRRRSIPYLLLGLLLVLACAGGFAVVSLKAGNRQPVLALARPVAVGQVLTVQDLRQVNVAVDPGVPVVDASQATSLVGKTLSTSLPPGTLLTPSVVIGAGIPAAGQAIAALALKPGQFPPEVSPGAHVSVVFVPGQAGSALASPPSPDASTVWPAVVTSVISPPNEQTTVVSVQLSEGAARQVAAVPAGQLSLVMLSAGGGR